MKKRILALLLCLPLILSGCSYRQTGIEGLLKPPKLSDQQNQIYTALKTSVGKNIRLKYPRTGDFTSAFLISDIDDEPTQEAIVFYESADAVNSTMTMRINVLDQKDGGWVSVYDAGVAASEVSKINFIRSNGNIFLVIGFELAGGERLVVVYRYMDGRLVETAERKTCLDYVTANLDADAFPELFTFSTDAKTGRRFVQAYRISSQGSLRPMGKAEMDPSVTSYKNIVTGKLPDGRQAIYLDGVSGAARYTTEVLVYSDGNVRNLMYDAENTSFLTERTARQTAVYSKDIDGDGVIEIPTRFVASGYENAKEHQKVYFTAWNVCTDGGLSIKKVSYVAYTFGFLFTLPDKWWGKVTPVFSSTDSELTFYCYDGTAEPTVRLLSLRVFKSSEFYEGVSGYRTLRENGQIIYAMKLYEGGALSLTEEEVKTCFGLYA